MHNDFEYQPTHALNRQDLVGLVPAGVPAPAAPMPVVNEVTRDLAMADLLDSRARVDSVRGRCRAARALHEQAMELRRARHGESDPHLVRSFSYLGGLSLREGLLKEARWLFVQAHQVACKRLSPGHLVLAATLHNLAVVERVSGNLAEASDLAEQALTIKIDRLGREHPSVATTLANLGNLARVLGQGRVAFYYYARAREILERAGVEGLAVLATVLIGLARLHLELRSTVSAQFLLERALEIRESIVVSPAQKAGVRVLLSRVLDPKGAAAQLRTALREYQAHDSPRPELLEHIEQALRDLTPGSALRKAS
jgi:tetratricopeptide (TPR) repeat protein